MKSSRPPSSWYCEYHEDIGHTIEYCYQLSNLIESKLRRGHLVHLIGNDIIFGIYSTGGSSNNSKKSYVTEVFNIHPEASKRPRPNSSSIISSFNENYPSGMLETHQDALVIIAKIGTNTVKKFH